ncbi:MarR family winged helix-turn-helix transcriptional regulator [Microbacterium sp. T32]|uniref:MarR family winged helix-turn-helix transcriptional regulator n=1 Tax=Microbacterium sp. T32 TaxID=1776083 RepID=UPI0007AB9FE4|nr:MarR family transcriptional regulator [Microbacterium sp. T32]KZE42757.1 MarR family transcriptional regulator [Microbacterium sp. T32]
MSRYDVPAESPYAFLDDDADVRAWFAFMKVQLRLRYEMNRQLRDDSGISLVDYDVLVALTSEPTGTMTVSDLAIRIGAERSRVSHQTRRLAGEGLVELASNAIDRRATDVTLTPAGRELLRRASPGHIAFVRKVFLDALDGESSAALSEAFERIYELLIAHGTLPRPADHP